MPTTNRPDQKYSDGSLNVSDEAFQDIVNQPSMQALADQGQSIIRDNGLSKAERKAGEQDYTANRKPRSAAEVASAEKNVPPTSGPTQDGFWTGRSDKIQLRGAIGRARNNRKALMALGIGGGILVSAAGAFLALLPMKLEMLIKSATSEAAAIPEHAIEHRLAYLTQVYISRRILETAAAGSSADIFVGDTITSGMFNAWRAANYEKQLGIEIVSDRTRATERGLSWEIKIDGQPISGDIKGRDLSTLTSDVGGKIDGSKNMRSLLNSHIKSKTHWTQFYKRYAMRKTLMRKYGVSKWSWLPDSASEKLDNYAEKKRLLVRDLRSRLYNATIGRISKLTVPSVNCISGDSEECKNLKDDLDRPNSEIKNDERDKTALADCSKESGSAKSACEDDNKKEQEAQQQSADQQSTNADATSGDIPEDILDTPTDSLGTDKSKLGKLLAKKVSKEVLAKLAAGVGLLDMFMSIVHSVNDGSLNEVMYVRNSTAYIGYSSEMLAMNDQLKAGKLDVSQVGALFEMLGDFGSSRLYQLSTGSITPDYANGHKFSTTCTTDDDGETTTLPTGHLLCDDRKVVYDKTDFTDQPWWKVLAKLADIWYNSGHLLFKFAENVIGGVMSGLKLDDFIGAVLNKTGLESLGAKGMKTLLNMVYGTPITGQETDGDAADNIIGGVQSSYLALGQTGQDMGNSGDGGGLGIGGAVMTPSQTTAMYQEIAAEKADETAHESMIAKLFDTDSTTSVTSQLVARTPTSFAQLAALPQMFMAALTNVFAPQLSAATSASTSAAVAAQLGINFNYSFSNSELEADPTLYTDASCKQMNDKREASYQKLDQYPIMVYTESDPCALEKVVADSGDSAMTNSPPEYFDLASSGDANSSAGGTSFRIASYNLHVSSSPAENQAAVDTMKSNNFDIIGMQEIEKQSNYDSISSKLKAAGYAIYPSSSQNAYRNGLQARAIAYNPTKYSVVGTDEVTFNRMDDPQQPAHAPVITMQDKSTGQQFIVMNTHNPAGGQNGLNGHYNGVAQRVAADKAYIEKIKSLEQTGLPVVFTGDMNEGYGPGTQGSNDYSTLFYCMATTQNLMQAVEKINPADHCKANGTTGPIDHIFASTQFQVGNTATVQGTNPGPDGVYANIGTDHQRVLYSDLTIPGSDSSAGVSFRIASLNSLDGEAHASDSKAVAGTNCSQLQCEQIRAKNAATVIGSGTQIGDSSIDVIGLQEVTKGFYDEIRQDLPGYDAYPADDSVSAANGLARTILWNKSKFSLASGSSSGRISYPWYGSSTGKLTWVKLKSTEGAEFYVYNVHPITGKYPGENVPGTQNKQDEAVQNILDDMKKRNTQNLPVFITGDMNSQFSTRPDDHNEPDRSKLVYCVLTRDTGIANAYDLAKGSDGNNCPTKSNEHYIDHVYASSTVKVSKWKYYTGSDLIKHTTDHDGILVTDVSIGGDGAGGGWQWPVNSKLWNTKQSVFLSPHTASTGTAWGGASSQVGAQGNVGDGIAADLGANSLGVSVGEPVYAMLSGTVISTSLCGSGDGIAIKSTVNGKTVGIAYMHGTNQKFKVGDSVKAGQQIMSLGQAGCTVYGAHLHVGMVYDGHYICPQDVFKAMGSGQTPDLAAYVSKANVTCSGRQ